MRSELIECIRKRELRRQKIVRDGNSLCLKCSGTGFIGYSTVCDPPEIKCDKCEGKGFSNGKSTM